MGELELIVGVTGHRELRDNSAWNWVRQEIAAILTGMQHPLIGITSLAIGADQIFAEIVVELGGQLEVVIPFKDYDRTFEAETDLGNYRRLKDLAAHVETLAPSPTDEEAYLLAGKRVVDLCEILVAVWDGHAAHGLGGTADIVEYAVLNRKKIVQVDPVERQILR